MLQEKETIFGHGKGFKALHGKTRHQLTEEIQNGELRWDDPMKEVDKWVDNLKREIIAEELKEEIEKTNAPITEEEFVILKRRKRKQNILPVADTWVTKKWLLKMKYSPIFMLP